MKKTARGYKKPEQHDQLEQSVGDIAESFDLIDRDVTEANELLSSGTDNSEELLWQNIKNTTEISLMKGVAKDG